MNNPKYTIHPSVFNAAQKHVDWHVGASCFDGFKVSPLYGQCSDLLTAAQIDEAHRKQSGLDAEARAFSSLPSIEGSLGYVPCPTHPHLCWILIALAHLSPSFLSTCLCPHVYHRVLGYPGPFLTDC
jgi:hypothetical protein